MAEHNDVLIARFDLTKQSTEDSILALEGQLAGLNTSDAKALDDLEDFIWDLRADFATLDAMQTTSHRKTVPYKFTDALLTLQKANKILMRAQEKIKCHVVPPPVVTQPNLIRRTIPEVKIKPFSGAIVDYASFKAAFKMKYDSLPISDAEKLQYLKENLSGNPQRAIQALELSDENYVTAFRNLDKQYNKPDDVVSSLYSRIESLPRASNKTADIEATYYELEGLLIALESHGHTLDAFPPLRKKVYRKYPRWLTSTICATQLLPVKEFQQAVATQISIRTSLEEGDSPGVEGSASFHARQRDDNPEHLEKPRETPPCVFCNEKHYSNECTKVTDLEERRTLIKDRCNRCLGKHLTKDCKKDVRCYYCRERNRHHQSVCPQRFGSEPISANEKPKVIAFVKNHKGAHTTAMVTFVNPITHQKTEARVLFDNGSSESYISEKFARSVGLKTGKFKSTPIAVVGTRSPIKVRSADTTFELTNNADFRIRVEGYTMPTIPQDVSLFDYSTFRSAYPKFADTLLLDQGRALPVDILLGNDYYFDILRPEKRVVVDEGLYIFETEFGKMLVGRTHLQKEKNVHCSYFTMKPSTAIDKLTALDVLGIQDIPKTALQEEEIALTQFYENISFCEKDRRYEVRWPWRENPPPLENNFHLALAILRNQQKRMNEETFSAYNEVLCTQLDSGIIEEIVVENPNAANTYYLPHHGVLTPEKTTPLRIVFNGAAKTTRNKSINEVIYKGINLLANAPGILIRTLLEVILVVGDIEKAFHQLKLHAADADFVRFLWLIDWKLPPEGLNLRFFRFLRVAFGIDASPFLLYATIRFHLEKMRTPENSKLIDKLIQAMYADNVNAGFANDHDAIQFFEFAVQIFASCSMNLRSWASNCADVRKIFTQVNASSRISILGIMWDQYIDTYRFADVHVHENATLRNVLGTISSFYNPCGWGTPVSTRAKIFLRKLHDTGYDWDDSLSYEHSQEWEEIQRMLIQITKMEFPRFAFDASDETATYKLHVFSDSSVSAYASVVYLHKISKNNSQIALLFAKSRITPRKPKLTIPKLELVAAVLAAKLITFVRSEISMKIAKTVLWIDSRCVLTWITTNRILPTYIRKRVDTIRNVNDVTYRYVPSEMNPADLPSRGGDETSFISFRVGPQWLRNEISWPQHTEYPVNAPEVLEIESLEKENTTLVAVAVRTAPQYPFNLNPLQFRSLGHLLRVTSYVMRFIASFKRSREQKIFEDTSLFAAQRYWIGYEQLNQYYDVIEAINLRKKHELIVKLNLYLDMHGIIRCADRYQVAPLSQNEKRPILLPDPKVSYFTYLIIVSNHEYTFHGGTSRTLHRLRRQFWIIAGRRVVYNVVSKCPRCKRETARPFPQPEKSDLPDFRLVETSPFTNIGVDTFGPIHLQGNKYYGLIVTDLVIRAIDLELLVSMTSEEIALALKRIFARRRLPELIVSDNALQFKKIKDEFSRIFTHKWDWKFLPAHAPWMGGAYERLVGLVKQSLARTFYNEKLHESSLRTLFAEVAGSLNSRPLTYVSADHEDDIITPEHFLNVPFHPTSVEKTADANEVRTYLKYAEEIRIKFWNVWRSAYLQFLRTQYVKYNFPKNTTTYVPRVGDVVIIYTKLQKRNKWPLGCITKLYPGSDQKVRHAAVKTQNGTLVRPLMELYPLELHTEVNPPEEVQPDDEWSDFEIDVEVVEDE